VVLGAAVHVCAGHSREVTVTNSVVTLVELADNDDDDDYTS
jgi:hypothetical protein